MRGPRKAGAIAASELAKEALLLWELPTVVLFLIGTGITRTTLKEVGVRPLVQGVTLWIVVASLSLWAIHVGSIALKVRLLALSIRSGQGALKSNLLLRS
jgi:hypothetical protein